ncbi:MAG: SOS response-associated peptidase [Acidimicrobiales bacterium]
MCGRVAVYRTVDVLADAFGARIAAGVIDRYEPGYNLAPTRTLPGLVDEHGRVLDLFHWGLANRSFNARGERISGSATARRLAVVVDGFFEWHEKRPLFFTRADGAPLALAGLLEGHHACTILTTAAGPDVEGIHDRMPVILAREALTAWLSHRDLSRHQVADLVQRAPAGTLVRHPVDPRVGDVRNDTPDLVAPYDPPVEPLRLFG